MKKTFLLLLTLAITSVAWTQEGNGFSSGDVFLSGTIGYASSTTGEFKSTGFTFAPRGGYFITNNIVIGLGLEYSSAGPENVKLKTTEIGALARYYFTPGSKFSIFGEFQVGYTSVIQEGIVDAKFSGIGIDLGPGVNYFISKSFALEARWGALSYETGKPDTPDNAPSTNTFNFGLSLSNIQLGLLFRI